MGTINDQQQCEEMCGKEVSNVPCFDVKAIIGAIGELTVTFAEIISAGNEFGKRWNCVVKLFHVLLSQPQLGQSAHKFMADEQNVANINLIFEHPNSLHLLINIRVYGKSETFLF